MKARSKSEEKKQQLEGFAQFLEEQQATQLERLLDRKPDFLTHTPELVYP